MDHGRINIEIRFKDGVASHQIQHINEEGEIQTLHLKGHGNKYFKNPELMGGNILETEYGYLCSSRQLNKEEIIK